MERGAAIHSAVAVDTHDNGSNKGHKERGDDAH